MSILKHALLPIILATLWISLSEFFRNEILLKSYWIEHYNTMGLTFPSEPINGVIWGLWSLFFAISIFIISRRFTFIQTISISWFIGFVLMWVVTYNLGVLPAGILFAAVPLSLLEASLAALIIDKLS